MFGQYPQQSQPQTTPAQPVSLNLDQVMQGGTPGAFGKNDPLGTSVTGEITEIRAEQQTDFDTGEPLFYPNGQPKPQIVIHLRTAQRDPNRAGDDGLRAIYVKGYNIAPLRLASQQAGVGDYPRVGDTLTATFSSTRPAQKRGYNDAKIYTYTVTPGNPGQQALKAAMTDPQAAAPQPAPQPQQGAFAYQQPAPTTTPPAPAAFPQPAGPTPQQATQIRQLAALGKTAQDIAGLTGLTVGQVLNVTGQPGTPTAGSEGEPEF